MKKILFSIVILIIYISACSAQKNLKPGYFIDLKLDTVRGFIDYRNDVSSSMKCMFYYKPDSEPNTFLPGDIYGYRIEESRFYVSKVIKNGTEEKPVFLEYLVNGITSLYFMNDNNTDRFFVQKGNDMYELTNNVSIIKQGNDQFFKPSNLYKGLLRVLYSDSEEIVPAINNSKFDKKSMMKLSEKYHNLVCTDRKCIVYEKKGKSLIATFGPAVSYEWLNANYGSFLKPFSFTSTDVLFLGVAANLRLVAIDEKINIGLKAMIGKDNGTGFYTRTSGSNIENNYLTIRKNKIGTSLHIKYEYPKGKFRPVIGIGSAMAFYISNNTDFTRKVTNLAGVQLSESGVDNAIQYISDFGISGTLGFNQIIKNNTLFLNLYFNKGTGFYREHGTTPGADVSRDAKTTVLGITTGFLF
jgi:hypothetical protein